MITTASIIGAMALFSCLSVRFLEAGGMTPDASPTSRQAGQASVARDAPTGRTGAAVMQPVRTKYILHKDIRKQIGRSLVTYRGKTSGDKIKLDVVVLDLVPEVTCSRALDIPRAGKGFHIDDDRYALISAASSGFMIRISH